MDGIILLKYIKDLTHKHLTEIFGSLAGLFSGIFGMTKGILLVSDDIHAIILAFFTGAAGGLGAIALKALIIQIKAFRSRKKSKASVSPFREPGSPRAKH